jgi:uncharacterized LabA/DUF88 family protein
MDQKKQPKKANNYAFIDNQNLNLGIQRNGWKMDWRKFRAFLRNEYGVESAYMFIGYMPENEELYNQMHDAGYLVVLKPTLEMFKIPPPEDAPEKPEEDKKPVKGNVDAELVLYAAKEMPNYDKAVIISGDGDFFSLVEYLKEKGKLKNLMVPNRQYSTLLRQFEEYIVHLEQMRRKLAYHDKRRFQGSNK